MRQATMTTAVPLISCCCPGHSTFFSSAQDSWKKRMPGVPEPDLVAALATRGSAGSLGGSSSVVGRGRGAGRSGGVPAACARRWRRC